MKSWLRIVEEAQRPCAGVCEDLLCSHTLERTVAAAREEMRVACLGVVVSAQLIVIVAPSTGVAIDRGHVIDGINALKTEPGHHD